MRDRYARLRRIESLDPERDEAEIRRLSGDDFYADYEQALRLALFRTYGVPSISALLDETGEFVRRGPKRYDDTTLILYEIFKDGPDCPRGRVAVKQLNRIHGAYEISNEDYVYTLATFVVVPARWIERYGWRKLSEKESVANVRMLRRMGEMMGLRDIPQTYAEFERCLDDYEQRHFGYTPANARVAKATLDVFAARLPATLRPLVSPTVRALLDAPLLGALGMAPAPPLLRSVLEKALRLRARVGRYLPPAPDGRGRRQPDAPTYPCGYAIEALGPEHAQRCPHGSAPDSGADARRP